MTDDSMKFQLMVHYILWYFKEKLSECRLGQVKLNKILWLLDVESICNQGSSMSGETAYVKRRYGPVPPHILATLEKLSVEGILEESGTKTKKEDRNSSEYSSSFDLHSAKIHEAPPDLDGLLNEEEKKKIESVCDRYSNISGKELSKLSHDRIYDMYKEGDKIPLSVYLVAKAETLTDEDREWAESSIKEIQGIKR